MADSTTLHGFGQLARPWQCASLSGKFVKSERAADDPHVRCFCSDEGNQRRLLAVRLGKQLDLKIGSAFAPRNTGSRQYPRRHHRERA